MSLFARRSLTRVFSTRKSCSKAKNAFNGAIPLQSLLEDYALLHRSPDSNFKVWSATAEDADTGLSGEVLSIEHDLVVRCGVGALRITELQRPGKTRSSAQAAVQGLHLQKGEVLQ